jgi:hypothetical protein
MSSYFDLFLLSVRILIPVFLHPYSRHIYQMRWQGHRSMGPWFDIDAEASSKYEFCIAASASEFDLIQSITGTKISAASWGGDAPTVSSQALHSVDGFTGSIAALDAGCYTPISFSCATPDVCDYSLFSTASDSGLATFAWHNDIPSGVPLDINNSIPSTVTTTTDYSQMGEAWCHPTEIPAQYPDYRASLTIGTQTASCDDEDSPSSFWVSSSPVDLGNASDHQSVLHNHHPVSSSMALEYPKTWHESSSGGTSVLMPSHSYIPAVTGSPQTLAARLGANDSTQVFANEAGYGTEVVACSSTTSRSRGINNQIAGYGRPNGPPYALKTKIAITSRKVKKMKMAERSSRLLSYIKTIRRESSSIASNGMRAPPTSGQEIRQPITPSSPGTQLNPTQIQGANKFSHHTPPPPELGTLVMEKQTSDIPLSELRLDFVFNPRKDLATSSQPPLFPDGFFPFTL